MKRGREFRETQRRYLDTIAVTFRPNTVIDARSAINGFIDYLEKEHPQLRSFCELERVHIEGWLRYLAKRKLRRNTRRNRILKVRSFLERIQGWDPKEAPGPSLFRRGDLPAEERYLPKPLSPEADRALKNELEQQSGLVPKALLLLRRTGLRCQELLDLKVDALTELPGAQWALRVPLGKLHSERVIPVDSETAAIFREISQLRGSPAPLVDPETAKPAAFLLVRSHGQRLTREALRYHLQRAEQRAQLEEHPTPHRLRHSYATEMLRAGISLPVLMRLLGHRSLGMTLSYAEVTGLDVQRAYAKTIEALHSRHEIPTPPATPEKPGQTRDTIAADLDAIAARVESFRRDCAENSATKKIQRLVERLRRVTVDFRDLTS